ncbi:hypothetical protein [Actinomyces oris]|uniref:hypothetical protein n=1 Tax=Actinomyces oris TaxID=544580 RepID=UPI00288A734F|nr:hypothetical protein [Actinomyces oris]
MSTETSPTKTTRTRVFQHPQARIKPLDAATLHEANTCLVYENGQAVAQLKRGRRCWGVYPTGMTTPAAFGASALEAVTAWMSARDGVSA